ncbi:MAG: Ig-like domain-containing protein, partial [Gammaproteobacteria bacterium]|nr:Ig-like domain-containing protein [Gammaproteobacteria bacterium]
MAELAALGATVQLRAEVRDQNSSVMAGAIVTWTSSASSVATVNASGLVTAVAEGMATITASSGSAQGTAEVTVVRVPEPVASVEVSPSVETIVRGATLQLTAEAFDVNGQMVAGAEFSWESSDAEVATVDASGLVTGVAEGTATITASSGSAQGAAEITVTATATSSDREILEAFYHATGGPNWGNSDNWLTDAPLADWHGVRTDTSDRVVGLRLSFNGLTGSIPGALGSLGRLTHLRL